MLSLNSTVKGIFLKLFVRDGYVLDFSNKSFDKFTMESVGIPFRVTYNLSKGKSLTKFLEDSDERKAKKILLDLFEHYENYYVGEYDKEHPTHNHTFNAEYSNLYIRCKKYVSDLLRDEVHPSLDIKELKHKFNGEYISKQIDSMMHNTVDNPTLAIGQAKDLIESCCKTILFRENITFNENSSLSELTNLVLKFLNLSIKNLPENNKIDKDIKALLGNLRGIVTKLSEIRNSYGSGHGKAETFVELEPRHSRLAVNSSIAFTMFLWDTFEKRGKNEIPVQNTTISD